MGGLLLNFAHRGIILWVPLRCLSWSQSFSPLPMQIMAHLLADMTMEAHLSLQPLLHLASVLSRDLQQDYLPLLPKLLGRVSVGD